MQLFRHNVSLAELGKRETLGLLGFFSPANQGFARMLHPTVSLPQFCEPSSS
jgi:hypothetical protein